METSDGGSPQLSAAHQQKNDVSATSGSAWMAGVSEGADPRHGDVQAIDEGKLEAAAVTAEQDVNAHENGEEEETADAEAGEEKEANPESLSDDGEGTTEEQAAFIKELDAFFRERNMEFKPPRFYGVELNCLKLWKAVMKLGGYKQVTAAKLWRQVGARFKPPITCTTVSWSFRGFYEKALLKYEKYKTGATSDSEAGDPSSRGENEESAATTQPPTGSGRARRDAAARAMQGWHQQRAGSLDLSDTPVKDKSSVKRDKRAKNPGLFKRKDGGKGKSYDEDANHGVSPFKKKPKQEVMKAKVNNGIDLEVIDEGPQADWVKINVHQTRDCFEVYALVPGLLREEVRIQCEGGGRLVIAGEPEQPENPWGVTAFRKVINLPLRIDAHQTSAVVTLHGQLFIRVPFAQVDPQQ